MYRPKPDPLTGLVYMHPQILALGLKLPLTKIVRGIVTCYMIAPSLVWVASRIVLGFEALRALIVPDACRCKFLASPAR